MTSLFTFFWHFYRATFSRLKNVQINVLAARVAKADLQIPRDVLLVLLLLEATVLSTLTSRNSTTVPNGPKIIIEH